MSKIRGDPYPDLEKSFGASYLLLDSDGTESVIWWSWKYESGPSGVGKSSARANRSVEFSQKKLKAVFSHKCKIWAFFPHFSAKFHQKWPESGRNVSNCPEKLRKCSDVLRNPHLAWIRYILITNDSGLEIRKTNVSKKYRKIGMTHTPILIKISEDHTFRGVESGRKWS